MPRPPRKIVHIDMDAFYASVEQRDDPRLRGRPVVVGGSPNSRGVVCAASYEARTFGVRSAMPASHAHRLCPDAVFLRPRFDVYVSVSRQIRELFAAHTDLIEPLSLDEAYLDVTVNKRGFASATHLAETLRREIREATQLTASAGVAPNKFLAKVASDRNKPDGLCVVAPQNVEAFLVDLPVRAVPGIGKVTEERCRERGIRTCGDLLRFSREELRALFGQSGEWFHAVARGQDDRPVRVDRERKSCGIEETFARDVLDAEEAWRELDTLASGLEARMRRHELLGRKLTLKVKTAEFRQITRAATLSEPRDDRSSILAAIRPLLAKTPIGEEPVRLLGLSFSGLLHPDQPRQLLLPFMDEDGPAEP